jgi:CspA family cold shock protein
MRIKARSWVVHARLNIIEGMDGMTNGVVKFFNTSKGFGFIAPDGGGKDVFIHITALQRSGLQSLEEGQKVSFEVSPGRDGRMAADRIKVVQ